MVWSLPRFGSGHVDRQRPIALMDYSGIKAELKSYEKSFKAEHGRAPTRDDIKANPIIAQKYKLYNSKPKAASKSVTPTVQSDPFAAPKPTRASTEETSPQPKEGVKTSKEQVKHERYDFATSPSKLRSMIAARSFSGSPNTHRVNKNPFTSPKRTLDTPKTKARKWLNGTKDLTPNRKLDWRSALGHGDGDALLEDAPAIATASTSMPATTEDDLDQSPVKVVKGKMRSFQPLFDDPFEPPATAPDTPTETATSKSIFGKDVFKPPPALQSAPPVKSKAMDPFDTQRHEEMKRPGSDHEDQPASKKPKVSKRNKTKPKIKTSKALAEMDLEEDALEDERLPPLKITSYKPYDKPARRQVDSDADQDDVFSDLEEDYALVQPVQSTTTQPASAERDTVMPAHLISLLSLDASPVKRHRLSVAHRKDWLVKKLLHEPSLSLQTRTKSGLDELNDDQESEGGGDKDGQSDDDWDSEPDGWKDLGADDLIGLDV